VESLRPNGEGLTVGPGFEDGPAEVRDAPPPVPVLELTLEALDQARDQIVLGLIRDIPRMRGLDLRETLKILDERAAEKRAKEGPPEAQAKREFTREKALALLKGR
jgi:hypothetical protein